MALVAMAVIILTASIGRRAKSTSAIQIKEPKLRPHTAAMPNVDHGGGVSCCATLWCSFVFWARYHFG